MYQGFYNLASGMLTQSKNLNVISNNMVNVQTAGYKYDKMVSTTFGEEMLYRGGKNRTAEPVPLAVVSKIKMPSGTYVNHDQGSFEQTGGIYDLALGGRGFFCVETRGGERYTRNGAFAVDEEGYLNLPGAGRILTSENQTIQIDNENFTVDERGTITAVITTGGLGKDAEEELEVREYGTLKIVDFADYDQMRREEGGIYSTAQAPLAQTEETGTAVLWKTLEKSNVDMVEEMTAMMSSQRALQSAAQVLRMYDQIISKSVSDVGKL